MMTIKNSSWKQRKFANSEAWMIGVRQAQAKFAMTVDVLEYF